MINARYLPHASPRPGWGSLPTSYDFNTPPLAPAAQTRLDRRASRWAYYLSRLGVLITVASMPCVPVWARAQATNDPPARLTGAVEVRASETYTLVANYEGAVTAVPSAGQIYYPQSSEGSVPFLTLNSPKESRQIHMLADQLSLIDATLRRRGYQGLGEPDDFESSPPWKYAQKPSAVAFLDRVPADFWSVLDFETVLKVHANLRKERFGALATLIGDNDVYVQRFAEVFPGATHLDRRAIIDVLDETLTKRIRDALETGHIGEDLPLQMSPRASARRVVNINSSSLLEYEDIDISAHSKAISQTTPYERMVVEIPWDRDNGVSILQKYWNLVEKYDLYDENDRRLIYKILEQPGRRVEWGVTRALFVKILAQDLDQYSRRDTHVNFVAKQLRDLQQITLNAEADFLSLHLGERLDNSDVLNRPCLCFPDGNRHLTLAEQKQKIVYLALQDQLNNPIPELRLSSDEINAIGGTIATSQMALLLARGPTQKVTPSQSASAQVEAHEWVFSTAEAAGLLTLYNRSITRDFAGQVLMVLEQRPTLMIGSYDPFALSSGLQQRAARMTSDAGPAVPFERAELEAAVSFATFMPKLDYLHFDDLLKMQSYVVSRMELDMTQRADELRVYGGQLLADYNRTLVLFNAGNIYTADVAEAKQVFVAKGEAVQQNDRLASVTPSYERMLEFTAALGQALPRSLSTGDRLSFQLHSDEPLPLSSRQLEALNKDPDQVAITRLLVALNQHFLSNTTLTGDVRQFSFKDGVATLTVFISLPSALRCVPLPKAGIGGFSMPEITKRVSGLSIKLKGSGGDSCVPLDGGFLKIGGSYTAELVL